MKHLCIILATTLLVVACSKSRNEEPLQPELSQRSLEIEIGSIAQIEVFNTSKIDRVDAPEMISATVSGNIILIEALSQGICDIRIIVGGKPLSCRITVNKKSVTEAITDENLNNPATRFVSSILEMHYSIPGTLVTVKSDTIEFRSLQSGDYSVSTPQSLIINGKNYPLAPREYVKNDGDTKWYRHRISDTQPVWVVISDL